MKTSVIFSLVIVTSTLMGCASLTPSNYVSRSTDTENVVSATGKAAENAALANTTYRGTVGGTGSAVSSSSYSRPEYSAVDQVIESTQRSFVSEVNSAIRQAMSGVFR